MTKVITRNLNRIIDGNFYPIPEAKKSNMRHRPIGLGVQGLADVFIRLRLPFESNAAADLNRDIFETIYFGAVTASVELAAEEGHYETYPGSPASKGILQYDMWNVQPSNRWDWTGLKAQMKVILIHREDGLTVVDPRTPQLSPGCSHAHGHDISDHGQQRVLRALHLQHLSTLR